MSLVNLQARSIVDPIVLSQFTALRNRLQAIAFADEICSSANVAREIPLAYYARGLFDTLSRSHQTDGRIDLEISGTASMIPSDRWIPLGLILNELVSNALVHAFPGDLGGVIRLVIDVDGNDIVLRVIDSGIGLPIGIDLAHTASLGLQLVRMLTLQLHGTCRQLAGAGTAIEVRFPAQEHSA